MTNQVEELIGTVERFVYQNGDNGFSVFLVQLSNKEMITVAGAITGVQPGHQVSLVGSWHVHPKFGKQFQAARCTAVQPTSIAGLKKYLGSGLIKGIGSVYAEKLVDAFGTQVLEVIDKSPQRLLAVSGIGQGRLEKIVHAWADQKDISAIMVFLQDRGVSATYAVKIYKKYGHDAIALVKENPYRLADDIVGIGFKTADTIAHNLGVEKNSSARIKAGMLFCISQYAQNGHLYIELQELKKQTMVLLELEAEDNATVTKHALHDLYNSEKIKLISHDEHHFVTLSTFYHAEKGVAAKIHNVVNYATRCSFDLDAVYAMIKVPQHEKDVELNEQQQKGIMTCVQNKITVITGGPGTGKTTLIKKLLSILDHNHCLYRLAAPTGRAAKRITEGTGRHASTIHRLLDFDFTTYAFKHNEKNALSVQFLIIDEASMIDIFLGHAILRALPLDAHLILIGDVDQLPSVGAGNFLNDIITSGCVPCVRLEQIFRQAHNSLIVVNAHNINKGVFPVSHMPDARRDFFFIKEEDPENLPVHLKRIFSSGIQQYGISPEHAMVLVPMNRGVAGTQKINADMQQILNPAVTYKEHMYRGSVFKINDRVMQIRNNYDKKVFNGDIGMIHDINSEDQVMHVSFDHMIVEYEFSELDELTLAYAVTIHKSQGSEYAAVIIPIFMQHFMLLQRNLLYTAITRAKKLCIFIGQPKAIAMAIKNNKGTVRKTFLREFLTTDLACR